MGNGLKYFFDNQPLMVWMIH